MHHNKFAPVVMFVYNRPHHTEQVLESLKKNKLALESSLYIFADGPKSNSKEELQKIEKTRLIIKKTTGFKQITITEKKVNEGLAQSVIKGVTEIIKKYGKVIVLEDDLLVSPYFLDYMNQGLILYQSETNIYSINAYMFPIKLEKVDTFLSPLATSSWGWATWSDKWAVFEENIKYKDLIQSHTHLRARFNFSDYNYAGTLDIKSSWAIKWYYSVFIRNGLGVFPTRSLVQNIGFDGSGTHHGTSNDKPILFDKQITLTKKHFIDIEIYAKMLDFFEHKKRSIFSKLSKKIKKNRSKFR